MLAKNWPYKRIDLTSVDHTSGLHCICQYSTSHFCQIIICQFAKILNIGPTLLLTDEIHRRNEGTGWGREEGFEEEEEWMALLHNPEWQSKGSAADCNWSQPTELLRRSTRTRPSRSSSYARYSDFGAFSLGSRPVARRPFNSHQKSSALIDFVLKLILSEKWALIFHDC